MTAGGRVVATAGSTITAIDAAAGTVDWNEVGPNPDDVDQGPACDPGGATSSYSVAPAVSNSSVFGLLAQCVQGPSINNTRTVIGSADLASRAGVPQA